MKWWYVCLSRGRELWLQSDTPAEDIKRMGYRRFSYCEVAGDGDRDNIRFLTARATKDSKA